MISPFRLSEGSSSVSAKVKERAILAIFRRSASLTGTQPVSRFAGRFRAKTHGGEVGTMGPCAMRMSALAHRRLAVMQPRRSSRATPVHRVSPSRHAGHRQPYARRHSGRPDPRGQAAGLDQNHPVSDVPTITPGRPSRVPSAFFSSSRACPDLSDIPHLGDRP
jgi:hypothetical protein